VKSDTVVLLAQSSDCGPAADRLCPAVTFHATRHRAEEHLRRHPELTGLILSQDHALDVARRSFASLLMPNAANGHAE
jgi:alkylmercury lyase-like protein